MWLKIFMCLVLSAHVFSAYSSWPYNKLSGSNESNSPLIITPFLEGGNYIQAQQLSRVRPDIGNTTSYSGFFTVNKYCNSNLFFWFFPALRDEWEDAPVLLWLQGGPGCSSLIGLFEEIGPLFFSHMRMEKRELSWTRENNILIIDQPVGVGYSFTDRGCYPENETEVGKDLYSAVIQFFTLFPNLVNNDFFIAGESFAGHYIPALGYTIFKNNPSSEIKIRLSAMMIGNGLSDLHGQLDYGSFLFQIGLIDEEGRKSFRSAQAILAKLIEAGDWEGATNAWIKLMEIYGHLVGDVNIYNYIKSNMKEKNKDWENFIKTPEIRKALHVGDGTYNWCQAEVHDALFADISRSVKPWIEELLEDYPIIFYYGQLDVICGYPMAINFIRSLTWSGQSKYLNATRTKWCVGKVCKIIF